MSGTGLGAAKVVGGMTLASRVLGLVREVVFARFFGAGAGMDVFIVAFQIPNFLRRLFAEGAFSQAFVPVLSEYRATRDKTAVRALAARVSGTLGLILLVLTVIGILAAPYVIYLFGSGFAGDPAKLELAVDMLRITFPYLFFISLVSLSAGLLNAHDRFAVPAFTPVLLNVCLISAALLATQYFERPPVALALGVFVAGLVQLLFQFPFLVRLGLLPAPRWGWGDPGVQKIVALMLPAIFGASVAQVNLLIDRHIASYLQTGSISWLYYSDRLLEFPLGVFAIALGTVILPGLSRSYALKNEAAFANTLDVALRWVAVIALPAACGLFILAGPMLSTVFQYGEFGARDVVMARYSLIAYAVGLVGFSLVKVLVPGYFSRQDTRSPVRIGIKAMVFNIIANFAFVGVLVKLGFVAPHLGLALATSLAAWLNATLLWRGLRRQGYCHPIFTRGSGWGRVFLQVGLACAAMLLTLFFLRGALTDWMQADTWTRVVRLGGLIAAGGGVYFAVLWLTGMRPAQLRGTRL